MQVQADPRRQLVAETRGGNSGCADAPGLAGGLELRRRELVDALEINELVVAADVEETGADGAAQEVVRAERVEAHVARHGH